MALSLVALGLGLLAEHRQQVVRLAGLLVRLPGVPRAAEPGRAWLPRSPAAIEASCRGAVERRARKLAGIRARSSLAASA
jgi:hypothetical protein